MNGDGFDDWIVGVGGSDAGGINSGAALVFFGGSAPNSTADIALVGAYTGGAYGDGP